MSDRVTEVIIDLPDGQDYSWFVELNYVGLSSRLDAAGRERALRKFREQFMAEECPIQRYPAFPSQRQPTIPVTCLPPAVAYVGNRVRHAL